MKTAEDYLREKIGEDCFNELLEWKIYPQPSGSFHMIDLIYEAINEARLDAIKEDRINLAGNAKAWVSTNGEWTSARVSAIVDKDSIINAPYPKLK